MTDEDILKRLAEIEIGEPADPGELIVENGEYEREWNPLTNWLDLGALIEKYKIELVPPTTSDMDRFSERELWGAKTHEADDYQRSSDCSRAICLAIIDANK